MNLPLRNNYLGCPCQEQGLGAVTKAQVETFFIGPNKYVRNSRGTNIYPAPGQAPVKVISANDNMGQVVGVNQAGTWGKLDSGLWIYFEDTMYTVNLSTPPPNSLVDAVGREVENLAVFSLSKIMPLLIGAGVILVGVHLASVYVKTQPK